MARNIGIIKLQGTLGKFSFYQRLGKDIVRRPGGPSAEQVHTKASFKRSRENLDEFCQGAVKAARTLRTGLNDLKHLWHPDLSGQLNKLFRQVIKLHDGPRGQRPVQLLQHKELLCSFRFHPDRNFDTIASFAYKLEANEVRNTVVLTIPAFDSSLYINAPGEATHYRILLCTTMLAEYVFDAPAMPYQPLDKTTDGCSNISHSKYIGVDTNQASISLQTAFPSTMKPLESTAVVSVIGVEFYQIIAGVPYLLKQQGCMKVAEVF